MIPKDRAKHWFLEVVWSFLNLPYRWGGSDPMTGFDCSGMVVEGLKAIGAIPTNLDQTADQLWHRYVTFEVQKPTRGCLAFWFTGPRATHVAVCLSGEVCLTADGGGSKTNTEADAEAQDAFIKIRPIEHRINSPRFVNIFED